MSNSFDKLSPEDKRAFFTYCKIWDLINHDENAMRGYIDFVASQANEGVLPAYMFMLHWSGMLGGAVEIRNPDGSLVKIIKSEKP